LLQSINGVKTTQIHTKSDIKKAKALDAWQKNGHVTNICSIVGIERKTS